MLTILVLFVGLTLATAVIAYWSDNLGKKLGKKRVSLWGMRPRTTATFLTIASSWLIMIFTLGVMLALFSPLRQALLRYDEVKRKERILSQSASELGGQVKELGGQLTSLQTQTSTLKDQVANASQRLAKVRAQLEKSRDAAFKARQARETAQQAANLARKSAVAFREREQVAVKRQQEAVANLQTVKQQRDATQRQREQAQRELKAAQGELKTASLQVEKANARVKSADERVTLAQNRVGAAEAQVKQAEAGLETVQNNLKVALENQRLANANAKKANDNADSARASAATSKVNAQLAEERAILANKRAAEANQKKIDADAASLVAQGKVIKAQKAVEQLEAQGEDLRRANDLALSAFQSAVDANQFILASDIRVPVGFTLVARTFGQEVSFSEATQRLHAIFDYAATDVVSGNTEKNRPALLPDAQLQLATRRVPLPKINEKDPDILVVVKEDEIYNSLATAISRSQTPLSVRLVADRNHLGTEKKLNVRFVIVPVRPALPEEAELVSATFSRELSDAQLFSALMKIVDAGRNIATQNGVMPPLSPEAPDFYAPGTNEKIFEALRKISALGGRARVRILTDKAISTADQLSVRFEVQPLSPVTAQSASRKAAA